jgi:hypothetical protein
MAIAVHLASLRWVLSGNPPPSHRLLLEIFVNTTATTPTKFKPFTRQSIVTARQWEWLTPDLQEAVQVVSHVLPFRTNAYVMDTLIDWSRVPDDPIYRLTFPHRDMLPGAEYEQLRDLVLIKKDDAAIARLVHAIRMRMNPHPAGQMTHNVPRVNDAPLKGLQHKYLFCCKTPFLSEVVVNLIA